MEKPDPARDLGDDAIADRDLLSRLDQVHLYQSGQVGLSGGSPSSAATSR